jgi:hypothetical protein
MDKEPFRKSFVFDLIPEIKLRNGSTNQLFGSIDHGRRPGQVKNLVEEADEKDKRRQG